MAVVLRKTIMTAITTKNLYLDSIKGKYFTSSAIKSRSALITSIYESSNNKQPPIQYLTKIPQLEIKKLPVPMPVVAKKTVYRVRKLPRSSSCPNLVTRNVRENLNHLLRTKSSEKLSHKQAGFMQRFFHTCYSALIKPQCIYQSKQGDCLEVVSSLLPRMCKSNPNPIQLLVFNKSKQLGIHYVPFGPKDSPIGICVYCSKCPFGRCLGRCKPCGPRPSCRRRCGNYRFDRRSSGPCCRCKYISKPFVCPKTESSLLQSRCMSTVDQDQIQAPMTCVSKQLGVFCVPFGPKYLPINPYIACCGCGICPFRLCKPCLPRASCRGFGRSSNSCRLFPCWISKLIPKQSDRPKFQQTLPQNRCISVKSNQIQVPVINEFKLLGTYCVPVGPKLLPENPYTACCGCGKCSPCKPCAPCCCKPCKPCGPCYDCGCGSVCGGCGCGCGCSCCKPAKPCCCGCSPCGCCGCGCCGCGCCGCCGYNCWQSLPWVGCPCGCCGPIYWGSGPCRFCCGRFWYPCAPCCGNYCGPCCCCCCKPCCCNPCWCSSNPCCCNPCCPCKCPTQKN